MILEFWYPNHIETSVEGFMFCFKIRDNANESLSGFIRITIVSVIKRI